MRRALWGDYYFKPKAKKLVSGASVTAGAKPLAVSLIWERLWAVYEAALTQPDEARLLKIVGALALDVPKRELAVKDHKMRLQAVMRAWLPVAPTVLGVVVRKLPSPVEAQGTRVDKLWPALCATGAAHAADGDARRSGGMALEARLAQVRRAISRCDPSPAAECVVYISKMFAVPKASLPDVDAAFASPGAAANPLGGGDGGAPIAGAVFPASTAATPDDAWWGMGALEQPAARADLDLSPVNGSSRRSRALHRAKERARRRGEQEGAASTGDPGGAAGATPRDGDGGSGGDDNDNNEHANDDNDEEEDDDGSSPGSGETLIAFARVFSGVLRPDAPVFVLGPRYSPTNPSAGECAHISQVQRPLPLYMMMGRELSPLLEGHAGNVIGIGCLARHVLKTATLCSTPACPSLSPMTFQTTPLVRVAIEPRDPRDLRAVERGLALLNSADPCVEVTVADNGELQLAALGELHLDRCVKDLVTRFARCEVAVSPPILSFQETLCDAPKPVQPPAAALAALGAGGTGVPHGGSSLLSSSLSTGAPGELLLPGGSRSGAGRAAPDGDAVAAAGGSPASPGDDAPLEFGRIYGGARLPWSWALPEAGIAYHPPSASVVAHTPDRSVALRLRALPLPTGISRFLQESAAVIKSLAAEQKRLAAADGALASAAAPHHRPAAASHAASSPAVAGFAVRLRELCAEAGGPWLRYLGRLWAFGPRRVGPNVLIGPLDAEAGTGADARLAAAAGVDCAAAAASLGSLWQGLGLPWAPTGGGGGGAGGMVEGDDAGRREEPPLGAAAAAGALSTLRSSIAAGFQLATAAGPLCGEPLWGVAFVVEEVALTSAAQPAAGAGGAAAGGGGGGGAACDAAAAATAAPAAAAATQPPPPCSSPASLADPPPAAAADAGAAAASVPAGQVMAVTRDACRAAFQAGGQRLVEAVFRCELQCSGGRGGGGSGEQLGRLYGVLARRRGRVVSEDVREGTQTFEISALLPVVESFGFADDLRKQTSGAATSPQLVFSHWELLDGNPLARAGEDGGDPAGGADPGGGGGGGAPRNLARPYVDAVRQRKGMPVESKIVAHAEKQRTLSRKK